MTDVHTPTTTVTHSAHARRGLIIISIIKNVERERASTAHARGSRDFDPRAKYRMRLTDVADSVYENSVVEVSLLHV